MPWTRRARLMLAFAGASLFASGGANCAGLPAEAPGVFVYQFDTWTVFRQGDYAAIHRAPMSSGEQAGDHVSGEESWIVLIDRRDLEGIWSEVRARDFEALPREGEGSFVAAGPGQDQSEVLRLIIGDDAVCDLYRTGLRLRPDLRAPFEALNLAIAGVFSERRAHPVLPERLELSVTLKRQGRGSSWTLVGASGSGSLRRLGDARSAREAGAVSLQREEVAGLWEYFSSRNLLARESYESVRLRTPGGEFGDSALVVVTVNGFRALDVRSARPVRKDAALDSLQERIGAFFARNAGPAKKGGGS